MFNSNQKRRISFHDTTTVHKGDSDVGAQTVNGITKSHSFYGGKIRRLPVDHGSEASSYDTAAGSHPSPAAEHDANHPLHNGNDMVVVNMPENGSFAPGVSKFPKLNELKHFHYNSVKLKNFKIYLDPVDCESVSAVGGDPDHVHIMFKVDVFCNGTWWFVCRDLDDFYTLDQLCHCCIYNRSDTQLEVLKQEAVDSLEAVQEQQLQLKLSQYLHHLLQIGIEQINCAAILEWFEISKDGNRRHASFRSGINVRGKAAARVIRPFQSSQPDELPLAVGTIVSIIDMPAPEVSKWWRGKKGLKVGFFPQECVELIEKGSSPAQRQKHHRRSSANDKQLKAASKPTIPASTSMESLSKTDRVFGGDLGAHVFLIPGSESNGVRDENGVPLVVRVCTAFIDKHGIVEGIYRLNGINRNIKSLKNGFEEASIAGCPELELDHILADQHCVSSLCKLYFRELPNPLLTFDLFDEFCSAVTQPDPDACYMALARCLAKLPPPHLRTTEHLMRHLNRLARQSNVTEMHARNLSIVWAPNLLQIRNETASPVNLMLIRRTAQVIEWLIERVDWFFGEDGLEAMQGPEPDPCVIPTRPEVPEPGQDSDENTPTGEGGPSSIVPLPLYSVRRGDTLTASRSACNISQTGSEEREQQNIQLRQLRRSVSDCSRLSCASPEPARVTVVSNPRKKSRASSAAKGDDHLHHSHHQRQGSRFRSIMHLPFRRSKKVGLDISLPTNIVTTVDVRLHSRINRASPVDACGLITPRETARLVHDVSAGGSASSPGAASGYSTLPYAVDEEPGGARSSSQTPTPAGGSGSLKPLGSGAAQGDDLSDLAKYAHRESSSSESDSVASEATGKSENAAASTTTTSPTATSPGVVKRRPLSMASSQFDATSSPATPTRSLNVQRVGKDMMSLGHPGTNVRYSQHILHWSFQDGEPKPYHLSGAPAEAPPDSARSLGRRRTYGSVSCMDASVSGGGGGDGGGTPSSFGFPSRQLSSSVIVRRSRGGSGGGGGGDARLSTLPGATTADGATTVSAPASTSRSVDGAVGGESAQTLPSSDSSGMLDSVLAAADYYMSPARRSEAPAAATAVEGGDTTGPMVSQRASLTRPAVLQPDRPLDSSNSVPGTPETAASCGGSDNKLPLALPAIVQTQATVDMLDDDIEPATAAAVGVSLPEKEIVVASAAPAPVASAGAESPDANARVPAAASKDDGCPAAMPVAGVDAAPAAEHVQHADQTGTPRTAAAEDGAPQPVRTPAAAMVCLPVSVAVGTEPLIVLNEGSGNFIREPSANPGPGTNRDSMFFKDPANAVTVSDGQDLMRFGSPTPDIATPPAQVATPPTPDIATPPAQVATPPTPDIATPPAQVATPPTPDIATPPAQVATPPTPDIDSSPAQVVTPSTPPAAPPAAAPLPGTPDRTPSPGGQTTMAAAFVNSCVEDSPEGGDRQGDCHAHSPIAAFGNAAAMESLDFDDDDAALGETLAAAASQSPQAAMLRDSSIESEDVAQFSTCPTSPAVCPTSPAHPVAVAEQVLLTTPRSAFAIPAHVAGSSLDHPTAPSPAFSEEDSQL